MSLENCAHLSDGRGEDLLDGVGKGDPAQTQVGEIHASRVVDPPHHEKVGLQHTQIVQMFQGLKN